jgi:uncharacterized protein (TIGR02466 family)
MAVRLLFPTFLFEYNLLEEGLVTETYLQQLKVDMDSMRAKDPEGRRISNAYTGWQSNDGVERRPIWNKMLRVMKDKLNQDVVRFHGVDMSQVQLNIGNVWANINDHCAWNKPHLHNGCWYSGALYIHAEGDEGNFVAINTDPKVVSDFPHQARQNESFNLRPVSGSLVLFPSACLHMVEPNPTNKDRYSVAFNTETLMLSAGRPEPLRIDEDWDKFEIGEDGELTK